jgi:hypothetical protein
MNSMRTQPSTQRRPRVWPWVAVLGALHGIGHPSLAQSAEPGEALCDPRLHDPSEYQVAIDRRTGITFIHSPCGWEFIGVVAKATIDADIARSGAKPVPARVLRAEIVLRPWLARYEAPANSQLSVALPARALAPVVQTQPSSAPPPPSRK